jgi:hypothetical protein
MMMDVCMADFLQWGAAFEAAFAGKPAPTGFVFNPCRSWLASDGVEPASTAA